MSATYTAPPVTDTHWVRFLTGDTDTSAAKLSDEEISAVLGEITAATASAKKYFAAAWCLESLHTKWLSAGQGIFEKEVGDLRIRWGQDSGSSARIEDKIKALKIEGVRRDKPAPHMFKVFTGL